jgi:hypothetical protein
MPAALVPIVVGVGPVMPRAAPTSLAVGHDRLVVAGVAVAVAVTAAVEAAAVGVAVPAALLDEPEPELALPQAATAIEQSRATPAATARR